MTTQEIEYALKIEYGLDVKAYPLGQDVTFFGSELECLRMAYKFKNKESRVRFSKNINSWYVSFPEWFSIGFSQSMTA